MNRIVILDTFEDFITFENDMIEEYGGNIDINDYINIWHDDVNMIIEEVKSTLSGNIIAIGKRKDQWKGNGSGYVLAKDLGDILNKGDDFRIEFDENGLYVTTYDHDGVCFFEIRSIDDYIDAFRLDNILYTVCFEKRNNRRFDLLINAFTNKVAFNW